MKTHAARHLIILMAFILSGCVGSKYALLPLKSDVLVESRGYLFAINDVLYFYASEDTTYQINTPLVDDNLFLVNLDFHCDSIELFNCIEKYAYFDVNSDSIRLYYVDILYTSQHIQKGEVCFPLENDLSNLCIEKLNGRCYGVSLALYSDRIFCSKTYLTK